MPRAYPCDREGRESYQVGYSMQLPETLWGSLLSVLYLHCRHMQTVSGIVSPLYLLEFLAVRVIVKKWGNSAAVRIPTGVMQAAGLGLDDAVDVREQGGQIVIEPIRSGKIDLVRLLAGITKENVHPGLDFGIPVGKESL